MSVNKVGPYGQLIDPTTGEVVGVIDGKGRQQLGLTPAAAAAAQAAFDGGGIQGKPRSVFLSTNILSTYLANVTTATGTVPQSQLDAINPALSVLVKSTAWPKIRELWVPMGTANDAASLIASRVKLKFPVGAANILTNVGLLAGDYTPLGGINTLAGAGKRLTTDFNPTGNLVAGEQGFGAYVFGSGSRGTRNADVGPGAAVISYTGYAGAAFGTNAASNMFLPLTSVAYGRIAGANVPARSHGRWRAMQQTAGVAQAWLGGWVEFSQANAAPTLANSVMSIAAVNVGDGSNFSGSIGGYAIFDPLTQTEMRALSDFFDAANIALGRAVLFEELCAVGDSNTFAGTGSGAAPAGSALRWPKLLSDSFGLIENNQGYGGGNIRATDANLGGNTVRRMLGLSARVNVVMVGTNDIANAATAQALADYESFISAAQQVGIPNFMVLGIGTVDWVAAAAAFAGTGYATNPHDNTQVPAWNTAVAAICARYAVPFFDISTIPNVLQSDGVHNSIASHASQSPAIRAAMSAKLL